MRTCLQACFITALVWLAAPAPATQALDLPKLSGHVNDYAHVLSAERAAGLETQLSDYEQRTGHQFALLTVSSLGGDSIESYSIHVAEQWKLGHKGVDDGLVLVVVPPEHKMRIEVGYGLEGMIPDAIAARIERNVLAPAFRNGDFAGGIEAAFGALMHAASGDIANSQGAEQGPGRQVTPWPALLPLLLPVLVMVLFNMLGGRRRRRHGGGFWLGPTLGGGGFGRDRGGGGGGGWRGGGGGGFGGGGASGSW